MPKGAIYLTPEQEARRDQLGLEAGLKGAAIGLGIGALGFLLVSRRSPEFRALSRPMQAIMPTAGKTLETKRRVQCTKMIHNSYCVWLSLCIG